MDACRRECVAGTHYLLAARSRGVSLSYLIVADECLRVGLSIYLPIVSQKSPLGSELCTLEKVYDVQYLYQPVVGSR